MSKVQWAAAPHGQWAAGNHGMHTCDANHCQLVDGGKTVQVTVPNMHGKSLSLTSFLNEPHRHLYARILVSLTEIIQIQILCLSFRQIIYTC